MCSLKKGFFYWIPSKPSKPAKWKRPLLFAGATLILASGIAFGCFAGCAAGWLLAVAVIAVRRKARRGLSDWNLREQRRFP
jgi:hypothetical protein